MNVTLRMKSEFGPEEWAFIEPFVRPHLVGTTDDGIHQIQFDRKKIVRILYTNYADQVAWRDIVPFRIDWTKNRWHPQPQWILHAYDVEKGTVRSFAVRDIVRWEPLE